MRFLSFLPLMLLTACAATPAPSEPEQPRYSAEDEALYMQRFQQLADAARAGLGLPGYDTMEDVPGAVDHRPLPVGPSARIDPTALAEAEDYAAKTNSTALLIWRDGKLRFSRYFGDTEADTPIISRSLAKPLGAVAVGRALALGAIESLDQPVADFVEEWRGTDKEAIRIRHLLDMRSGFIPQAAEFSPEHILNRAYLHPRHDEVIINDMPMAHAPGAEYEYANATAEMVAPLIERATGRRYAEFLSNEILKPIGARGGEVWVNRPGGTAHSGCCILLPAEDWMRLAVLLLNGGEWNGERLLPAAFVQEMRRGTPQNPHYGLGVYVAGPYVKRRGFANKRHGAPEVLHAEPYLADDLFLFDGNGHQTAFIVPSADLAVLRLGDNPPKGMEWDNSKLPNKILAGMTFPADQKPRPQEE